MATIEKSKRELDPDESYWKGYETGKEDAEIGVYLTPNGPVAAKGYQDAHRDYISVKVVAQ